eukprot:g3020.t1
MGAFAVENVRTALERGAAEVVVVARRHGTICPKAKWNSNTDVVVWRRAEKVLKTLDWSLQAKLDHVSETTLASPSYLTEILNVLDVLAGENEDSERRRAVRAALFEGHRKSEETLAQYALRRESQFEVASRYMTIPEEIKGILLEEQSGLSKQSMQSLRVLTRGLHSYSEVKKVLKVLDLDEESIIKNGKVSYFDDAPEYEETDSEVDDDTIFSAFELADLGEDAAMSLMADLQQDRRQDITSYKRRLSVDELKKVTFCGNCGKKGHWREDCTEPAREGGRRDRDKGQKMNAFAYLGLSEGAGDSIAFLAQNFVNYQFTEHASFPELDPGQAIVDPGASQDLIGLHSYNKPQQKLAEVGLKTIKLKEAPAKASGVGGAAKTLFMALAPCVLGGQPGVIKLTVVDGDVPQLLSIGLLEYGQAIIDTGADKIDFKKFNTSAKMTRLPSGHRTLDVIEWGGSKFPIPSSLAETFGLKEGDFNLPSSDRRAYMAARPLSMELSCFFSQKYGKDNPPPAARKTKGVDIETYVSSSAAAAPRTPMVSSGTTAPAPITPDLESAFQGQNQQLLQNTAALMSQVMLPVVEGFHQALRFQTEEAQRAQERQDTQLQQLFLNQQRIMQQTDPTRQPGAAFPALPPEELHRLLAQGFAMAQQHPLPDEEDWDQISEHQPGRLG